MILKYLADHYGSKQGFLRYWRDQVTYKLGGYNDYTALDPDIKRVVFVCQGNICRSALAEEIFRATSQFPVASVGLKTHTGKPANARMLELASSKGIDLQSHMTTCIQDYPVEPSDLLVCMEIDHINQLNALGYENKKVLLGTLLERKQARINDPYSANDTYMEKCSEAIEQGSAMAAKFYNREASNDRGH